MVYRMFENKTERGKKGMVTHTTHADRTHLGIDYEHTKRKTENEKEKANTIYAKNQDYHDMQYYIALGQEMDKMKSITEDPLHIRTKTSISHTHLK